VEGTLVRLLVALAAIGALLFALRAALEAIGRRRFGLRPRGRLLRVVDSLALGPGTVLHVVEVDGRRLVLAAAQAQVTLLCGLAPGTGEAFPAQTPEVRPTATEGIDPCCAKLASDVG
jgi:flagellar biogenesis protein FliO